MNLDKIKRSNFLNLFYFLLLFLSGCADKKQRIDFESIEKKDAFRSEIKTGNFVKLSGGYTYYEFQNREADTLMVMVHGFSVPSYIWDSTFNETVKRGYGALRYDTYGRGYSNNPDVIYDVAFFSNQLKELLDSLKISRPVNLLGLSDGGRTISAFASQYPQLIKNLVYVDAAGFETLSDSTEHPATVSEEEIKLFKSSERYQNMAGGQLSDFYDSIPFRGWDKKYQTLLAYKGFVHALLSTNKNRTDLTFEHKKIAASGISVFAFWGEYDTVVKLEKSEGNMKSRIPNVKLIVIEKAGHLPNMEQAKKFNAVLIDGIVKGKW